MFALMSRLPLPRIASRLVEERGESEGRLVVVGNAAPSHHQVRPLLHHVSGTWRIVFRSRLCLTVCVCVCAMRGGETNFSFYFSGIFLCTLCSQLPSLLASCCNYRVVVVVVIVVAAVVVAAAMRF